MDNGLLLMSLGGLVLTLLISYLIIKSAINSSNLQLQAEIQTRLLAKIAARQGVSVDEINECYQG